MLELEFHDLGLDSDLLLTSGKPVWYPVFDRQFLQAETLYISISKVEGF